MLKEDRVGRNQLRRSLTLVVILTLLIYGGLLFYGDYGATARSMAAVAPSVAIAAALLSIGNYVIRCVRWHLYLRHIGRAVAPLESANVFFAGFAMTITPAKAGEVLKSLLLKRTHGFAVSETAPIVLAERVTDLAGLVLMLGVGSLAILDGVIGALSAGVLVILILVLGASRRFAGLVLSLSRRLPLIRTRVDRVAVAFESLHKLSSPAALAFAVPLSTLAWSLQGVSLWLLVRDIESLQADLLQSMAVYSMPLLAGTLSMLPGGLGLAEASMAAMLGELNPDAPTASLAAATIWTRLVTFWLAVAIGWIALAVWRLHYGRRVNAG